MFQPSEESDESVRKKLTHVLQHNNRIRNKIDLCLSFFLLQKLSQEKRASSCERPANDRKRKFIKSDLAQDTEGRQRAGGEVNFTAPKHLAKFNWFVATCTANYRISITTPRPMMILTSLCQRSDIN